MKPATRGAKRSLPKFNVDQACRLGGIQEGPFNREIFRRMANCFEVVQGPTGEKTLRAHPGRLLGTTRKAQPSLHTAWVTGRNLPRKLNATQVSALEFAELPAGEIEDVTLVTRVNGTEALFGRGMLLWDAGGVEFLDDDGHFEWAWHSAYGPPEPIETVVHLRGRP